MNTNIHECYEGDYFTKVPHRMFRTSAGCSARAAVPHVPHVPHAHAVPGQVSRERSETGCFIEPVPRGSREVSRGPCLRFFDGFGISIGIHFAFVEPSNFGLFFGCVPGRAHDEKR